MDDENEAAPFSKELQKKKKKKKRKKKKKKKQLSLLELAREVTSYSQAQAQLLPQN